MRHSYRTLWAVINCERVGMNPHIKSIHVFGLIVLCGACAIHADAGISLSAVVMSAGVTWRWGPNHQGQLGDASSGRSIKSRRKAILLRPPKRSSLLISISVFAARTT